MKFKLDENLPAELCSDLRTAGYEADTVHAEGLTGADDPTILDHCRTEGRILLTMDKGIADVRAYPPEQYSGIVLFRPPTSGRTATLAFIRSRLPTVLQTEPTGHLLVVTDRTVRIR